jgi:cell division inhibitor SulA
MPRFVIERDIPGIGLADRKALREAAKKSNGVLAAMNMEQKNIQWEHSYVAGDKTFCIYIADNESLLKEHSQRSGFPITKIIEVIRIIDPVTAESSQNA